MIKPEYVPQIPYGTRDFLPREAARKRAVEGALAQLFGSWGYDEVVTPTFEYLETLQVGSVSESEQHMFKFLDKNNRILALRPDMTTPIARTAATRLREAQPPLRLFYLTNVFRYEQAQAGRQCEFYQAGVELLGAPGPAADAEVIALAVAAMQQTGLTQFQISLGQVDFINGIMEESDLSPLQRQQVKVAMVRRDLVGLGEILAASGLSSAAQKFLQTIPILHGRQEVLDQAYQMAPNAVSKAALDNLSDILELLAGYGVEKYVNFDLGLIRDFDYYTGMVFEGYTPGLGFPLCGGGRYDHMLAAFGSDNPATGFALGIERVLLAQERQGMTAPALAKDMYVAWDEGNLAQAIAEATRLRQEGWRVDLALRPASLEQAEQVARERGCTNIQYIGR